jgi:heme A synthase
MLELAQRVNWSEYAMILSQGSPSIGLQLAVINVVLLACWLRRRAKPKQKQGAAWMLQLVFVAANVGVVTLGDRLAF